MERAIMANRNDYVLVKKFSLDSFEDVCDSGVIKESALNFLNKSNDSSFRERIGFYYLVLKNITGEDDPEEISKMIIDTEYMSKILGISNNDLGVDAYYINEEKREIQIFNFKYRSSWKQGASFKAGDSFATNRFLALLANEGDVSDILNDNSLGNSSQNFSRTIDAINEITNYREKDDDISIVAYFVSNESSPMPSYDINIMQDTYGISVRSISLGDISGFLTPKREGIQAKLKVPTDKMMVYRESDDASNSSYIFSTSLYELARITSKSEDVRMHNSLEWEDSDDERLEYLKQMSLETSLLHDNVRGYLGSTPYNKGIIRTLEEEPSKFFMFNNGVTITANDVLVPSKKGAKFKFITLKDFQVVNGGQTLRSVHEYIKSNSLKEQVVESLRDSSVLIRAYNTKEADLEEPDSAIATQIARYTNSQNAISPADLRSNDEVQIQIQTYLAADGYDYVLKRNLRKRTKKNGSTRIPMELMAQILITDMGKPEEATNQKRKLFNDYYDDIFGKDLSLESIPDLLRRYREIEEHYLSDSSRHGNRQKYLYLMYIMKKLLNISIEEAQNILELSLDEYSPGKKMADSRKLIYPGFKDLVDKKIQEYILS